MLFTISYNVISVNMFATKLLLRLDSVFCSIKRKNVQISKSVLGFQAQLYIENS